jgi:hypothetical protein
VWTEHFTIWLYVFDGTWNEEKTGDDSQYTNTNVPRFHEVYTKNSKTKDFYVAGIGTRWDVVGKIVGGAFGLGELPRLDEAYDALCVNWNTGDRTIDIVGFNRGAATTLDFCRLINARGIRNQTPMRLWSPIRRFDFSECGTWWMHRVYGPRVRRVGVSARRQAPFHRAGQARAERVHRKLQRAAARRMASIRTGSCAWPRPAS